MKNKIFGVLLTLGVVGLLALGIVFFSSPSAGGDGEPVKLGARSSAVPKEWIKEKPSNKLRQAQFRVPKAGDDKDDGEVAIFYFPGGGSVDENLARWKDKFSPPTGKKKDEIAKVDTFKVNGVDVTYLNIYGTYKFVQPARPDYRMLAVYFDSDDGPFFVTFIGPEKTVVQHKDNFDKWLKAFK